MGHSLICRFKKVFKKKEKLHWLQTANFTLKKREKKSLLFRLFFFNFFKIQNGFK